MELLITVLCAFTLLGFSMLEFWIIANCIFFSSFDHNTKIFILSQNFLSFRQYPLRISPFSRPSY